MIEGSGFLIERISHFSLEQDPFSLMQGWLNYLTGNDNFLYSLLHREHRIKGRYFRKAFTFILAFLLFIPSLIFSWAFAVLKKGSTVEIYALKEAKE